tara:strand:- start:9496 stop:9633 length:138 start_codon:yes stop_codon:yes gene_type:complete
MKHKLHQCAKPVWRPSLMSCLAGMAVWSILIGLALLAYAVIKESQ